VVGCGSRRRRRAIEVMAKCPRVRHEAWLVMVGGGRWVEMNRTIYVAVLERRCALVCTECVPWPAELYAAPRTRSRARSRQHFGSGGGRRNDTIPNLRLVVGIRDLPNVDLVAKLVNHLELLPRHFVSRIGDTGLPYSRNRVCTYTRWIRYDTADLRTGSWLSGAPK
jgi:hypothetical protein